MLRRAQVSCEADVVCSITLPVRKHKGAGSPERQRIVDACRKCFLLADMDLVVLYSLVDAMTARHVKQGEVVIREGASGDCLYVVDHGAFRASQTAGRRHVFKYDGSGAFGELSLMYDAPRAATVKVTDHGRMIAALPGRGRDGVAADCGALGTGLIQPPSARPDRCCWLIHRPSATACCGASAVTPSAPSSSRTCTHAAAPWTPCCGRYRCLRAWSRR